jgi:hypothetical protein
MTRKWMHLVVVSAAVAACSAAGSGAGGAGSGGGGGSSSGGSSPTGLDGTWAITFSSSQDFKSGTLTVTGNAAKLALSHQDDGLAQGGCTFSDVNSVDVTVAGDGTSAVASSTDTWKASGSQCHETPGSAPSGSVTASRSGAATVSSFGVLGGNWTVTATGSGACQNGTCTCTMNISGDAVLGTCQGGISFSGTLNGNTFSGSAPGYEFAALRQ